MLNRGRRAVAYATISLLNRSMIGERYSFCPPTLNSVTSVTHFSFGCAASNRRARMLSLISMRGDLAFFG